MNIDANIQKMLTAVLKRWKIVVLLGLICAMLAFFYTANFTTLTYSSNVKFLAYAVDTKTEFNDSTSQSMSTVQQQASNTSKMNYAMKMLTTCIELFKTNEFTQSLADELNETYSTSYTAAQIKNSVTYTTVNDTALFIATVTTTDPDLSYQLAKQLETSIPNKLLDVNQGLVQASVEDHAVSASSSNSLQYPKKCIIGFAAGVILAVAYIILRDLLDIRIRGSEELSTAYNIPVLGTIPEFELKLPAKKLERRNSND